MGVHLHKSPEVSPVTLFYVSRRSDHKYLRISNPWLKAHEDSFRFYKSKGMKQTALHLCFEAPELVQTFTFVPALTINHFLEVFNQIYNSLNFCHRPSHSYQTSVSTRTC